ncbi:MAG: cytochrome c peroxidase [Gemmatimonas sp.]
MKGAFQVGAGRNGRHHAFGVSVAAALVLLGACGTPRADTAGADAGYVRDGVALATRARDGWVAGLDSLLTSLQLLEQHARKIDGTNTNLLTAQQAFRDARRAFKRVEFAIAYYEPSTTASLNGAALPRVEYQDGPEIVFPPEGLQVIEEWLFTGADTARRESLVLEIRNAQDLTRRARTAAAMQMVTDNRVWDAASIEIARVATLGIVGFDSPIAQNSMAEGADALRGVRAALAVYQPELTKRDAALLAKLDSMFVSAISALDSSSSFVAFERLSFIANNANPLGRQIQRARMALELAPPENPRVLDATAGSIFDVSAIVARGFANPRSDTDTPAQVALGRQLFFEARLSGDASQSCATCHDPDRAFTDGRVRSVSRVAHTAGAMRNTPTIINAALQSGMFADQRTAYLEDQVEAVLTSPNEMHSSSAIVMERLHGDSTYRRLFTDAFKGDSAITGANMRKAIAAYIRSLNALSSRADRAMRGDQSALSAAEVRGFNLYAGKAKCATCHFIPLFNGAVPPAYRSSDVEVLGVPTRPVTRNATIDPDSGRFRITRSAPHLFAFKTPSIRNIELTAPYMHNGVYKTLEEVVDFYNRGGGKNIGIELENQTLPFDSLQLTAAEQKDIVSFMKALTDTTGTTARPAALPLRSRTQKPSVASQR